MNERAYLALCAFINVRHDLNMLTFSCTLSEEQYAQLFDKTMENVRRLGERVAAALEKPVSECSDLVIQLIQDENQAKSFIDRYGLAFDC